MSRGDDDPGSNESTSGFRTLDTVSLGIGVLLALALAAQGRGPWAVLAVIFFAAAPTLVRTAIASTRRQREADWRQLAETLELTASGYGNLDGMKAGATVRVRLDNDHEDRMMRSSGLPDRVLIARTDPRMAWLRLGVPRSGMDDAGAHTRRVLSTLLPEQSFRRFARFVLDRRVWHDRGTWYAHGHVGIGSDWLRVRIRTLEQAHGFLIRALADVPARLVATVVSDPDGASRWLEVLDAADRAARSAWSESWSELLRHESDLVRAIAAAELARDERSERVVGALVDVLGTGGPVARRYAASVATPRIGERMNDALASLVASDEVTLVAAALYGQVAAERRDVEPADQRQRAGEETTCIEEVVARAESRDLDSVAIVAALLGHPRRSTRLTVLRVLADIGDASSVPAIRRLIETDEDFSSAARRAIRGIARRDENLERGGLAVFDKVADAAGDGALSVGVDARIGALAQVEPQSE